MNSTLIADPSISVGMGETATVSSSAARSQQSLGSRWRNSAANVAVAGLFFIALLPGHPRYGSALANWIWLAGAAFMGFFSLIRISPSPIKATPGMLLATSASMLVPLMTRLEHPSTGSLASAAIVVELIGVTISQLSRVYLGRRFGLLPANRGVITGGPFRFVRHPIYAGWLILSMGFVMAYPTVRNLLVVLITTPFVIWRIAQEENLLANDPIYCTYQAHTKWRLIPLLY